MSENELSKEEIEEIERQGEEDSHYNWLMEKADHAMWRSAVRAHLANGIKPLISF